MSQTGSGKTKYTKNGDGQETRFSIREQRRKERDAAALKSMGENQGMLLLFIVIIACLAVILASILTLNVPAVLACAIVLIEAALVLCLQDVPVWLHGLTMLAQVVAGIYCQRAMFMIMCAAFYLFGVLMLGAMKD